MTLTRRALLVILPVVLASNLLVALSVYLVQRRMIADSEQTQFSIRMDRLANAFLDEVGFTHNLVFSMLTGEMVREFIREESSAFRITGLGVRVQDGINFFSGQARDFVSFAIVGPDGNVGYYFENSDDPFAEIRPEQIRIAQRLLTQRDSSSDDYVAIDDGGLLIHSQLVDRRTLEPPLATQREFAYVIQAAVKPKTYAALKSEMEQTYDTPVRLTTGRGEKAATDPDYRRRVTSDLELQANFPEAYLQRSLDRLKLILAAGSIVLSLLSVGLLLFLIRRTVTQPISMLDREVTEVIEGKRERLGGERRTGEVGRLAENIKSMHDETLRAFRQVQQMTWTDSLTGISNRPRFNAVGQDWMATPRTLAKPLALLFIDLDHFKAVNDTYGHGAGDAVLKAFAHRARAITDLCRAGDTEVLLFRLAGDEFAILLGAGERAAVELAGRIVDLFGSGLEVEGRTYAVSASIGIAMAPAHAKALDDLISCADIAMYKAKAAGRNGFAVFQPSFAMLSKAS